MIKTAALRSSWAADLQAGTGNSGDRLRVGSQGAVVSCEFAALKISGFSQ
jgi:hypothetical protein